MSQPAPGASWTRAGFFTLAVATNLLYAIVCIRPDSYVLIAFILGLLVVVPLNFIVGGAWAVVAARSRQGAWCFVVLVAILPLMTLLTLWPLRLGFLLVMPAMERMADEAAAGRSFKGPAGVGPFAIQEAVADPDSHRVDLLTEPNPSHPAGFVRVASHEPQGDRFGPVAGSNMNIHLYGRWSFREDD